MVVVGVSQLRADLSGCLRRVKEGETLSITEDGREIGRLIPSRPAGASIARLVTERGAAMPRTDLVTLSRSVRARPAASAAGRESMDELREERL